LHRYERCGTAVREDAGQVPVAAARVQDPPPAHVGLAGALDRTGDPEGAEALYWDAAEAGDTDWSGHASCALGDLLQRRGDAAGAAATRQRVIESRNPERASTAYGLGGGSQRRSDRGIRARVPLGGGRDRSRPDRPAGGPLLPGRAAASPRRQHPHRARVSHHEFLVMFNFVVMPIPWEETPEQDRGLPDPVAGHAARVRRSHAGDYMELRGIRRYRSRLRLAARGHRLASRYRPGAETGPGAGSCS